MRDIKFRAWDKTKNEMNEVLVIDYLNGFIDLAYGKIERRFDEVELMQSAELLDQHNVEIYEGDIVNVHVFTVGGSYDGAIESEDTYKKAIITFNRLEDVGFYEWCIKTKDFEFSIGSIEGLHEESFEVIGNIYENPELLKEE